MTPCRIKPARLSDLLDRSDPGKSRFVLDKYEHDDSDQILNRMLRIAESPIVDYFFGMPEALRKLGEFYGARSESIFTKSFGEVAYDIGFLCHDPLLSPLHALKKYERKKAAPDEQSSLIDEPRDSLDLSSRTQDAILAFLRPLSHTEHVCVGNEYAVPRAEWLKPTTEKAASEHPKRMSLSSIENAGSYFDSRGGAQEGRSPELRILQRFYFPSEKYFDAVRTIYGQEKIIDESLRLFSDAADDFLGLIAELENVCGHPTSYSIPDPEIEASFGPFGTAPSTMAYTALYNLYIRPFALIHIEHEPLKRHIENVNLRCG